MIYNIVVAADPPSAAAEGAAAATRPAGTAAGSQRSTRGRGLSGVTTGRGSEGGWASGGRGGFCCEIRPCAAARDIDDEERESKRSVLMCVREKTEK